VGAAAHDKKDGLSAVRAANRSQSARRGIAGHDPSFSSSSRAGIVAALPVVSREENSQISPGAAGPKLKKESSEAPVTFARYLYLFDERRGRENLHDEASTRAGTPMTEAQAEQTFRVPYASINVLVADDHEANREAFQTVIRPLGYSVFLADSGKKVLELAARTPFSVILLDVRMPMMNGLDAAVELRRLPLSKFTPILFVSAHEETQVEVSRKGIPGMTDFIFSPVNPEVLTWKLDTWVEFGIRQEVLRRRMARVSEAQEALHEILGRTPIPLAEATVAEAQLAQAVRLLSRVLSEPIVPQTAL
jgi:CheY-like chemotaxis protein